METTQQKHMNLLEVALISVGFLCIFLGEFAVTNYSKVFNQITKFFEL